jgi:hypothetical protein
MYGPIAGLPRRLRHGLIPTSSSLNRIEPALVHGNGMIAPLVTTFPILSSVLATFDSPG